ncbi:MAG: 16S rRNA (guanine(966)-N(2))-methyltransferase RsmD [Gammaproteobacteria bacterium]|nr:16S rRNA (guanine(966)-N(2))-methyltransferase RsmD [Gammaproteobacteria bacterium]MDH5592109.1 16S rRNA (guanine(966)-N(2))-methyltransferase RsmD [Gammaproteobacteria bacterium]
MAKQNKAKRSGEIRLIAGRWRGRKLTFPDLEGLRPTPDRVRETIFNWLQARIGGARCLDLCAGSGALGFEAASRGAEQVTMVELSTQAVKQLQANCQLLAADNCRVENKTAQQFLNQSSDQYDIVFIDPPYQADLWTVLADQLVYEGCLAENAQIYIECPSKGDLPTLPEHWQLIKDKKAGEVRYCLYQNTIGEAK